MTHVNPTDDELREILSAYRTIAMVGASSRHDRPSLGVMKVLLAAGFDVLADIEEHGRTRVAFAEREDATGLLEDVPAPVRSLEGAGHRVESEPAHRPRELDLRDGRHDRRNGCRRGSRRRAGGRRR